ncbi:[FeFe] hydrogenase H-cluster maturation GTPase HydF [Williamwhitmania taraxaci]|uniref:Iron-only hydrogenase maturation protein HydF n=1 Tax=Williamwhitmania taraxaci TaxID=1640674 RepID=A0A1G6HBS0_9BACT|nr:[FeFe] hydrogenase H-cluster maturation GTPase HydF [Williamwhitmania taraxaci]SDB91385.1 iron-only hydrogenase maturation protein HydF [Williamwhitmania taraxaci]
MPKGKASFPHIGIYGKRNSGKSATINFITGQDVAIVSDIAGTTTDPVKKTLEILDFGPVVLVDTAGIDDVGELGQLRIQKTKESIKHVDLALLVITNNTLDENEEHLIEEFAKYETPYVIVHNHSDREPLLPEFAAQLKERFKSPVVALSAFKKEGLEPLITAIKETIPERSYANPSLMGDLIVAGDIVLLITPIDTEAPAGRMILPQVQAIRDVLDNDAVAIVLKENEVVNFLKKTGIRPALAVTDSQVFNKADAAIPHEIPLTSFSTLLARLKGDFDNYLLGTPKISELRDGDKILILESCTHHVSCDDIGRFKIPNWLNKYTGKKLEFKVVTGLDQLPNITDYALVIQCGGCMITRKQIFNRLQPAIEAGIPITNYGMAIAYVQGIYNRAIAPFTQQQSNPKEYL